MDNPVITEPREAAPEWARSPEAGTAAQVAAEAVSGAPKITPNQRSYLLDLIAKKQVKPEQEGKVDLIMKCLRISEDPEEYGMSRAKASELIDWYLKQPDKPREEIAKETSDVPDGYYALRNVEGHKNEVSFFRLNTGKHGKWKGFQFIDQVVGHGKRFPMRGRDVRNKLYALIREQGINEARMLYGQEFGQCGVCHRELTDDLSRARGIGPVCWDKYEF